MDDYVTREDVKAEINAVWDVLEDQGKTLQVALAVFVLQVILIIGLMVLVIL